MSIDYRAQAEAFAEFLITLPKARKRVGQRVSGRCPTTEHEDKNPSFSFDVEKDAWACSCGNGKGSELRDRLGWKWSGAIDKPSVKETKRTEYKLLDRDGNYVASHIRFDYPDRPKAFVWSVNGVTGLGGKSSTAMPLYRVHEAIKAPEDAPIYLTEGEKACDALACRGVAAVSTTCGAQSTPTDDVLQDLSGRKVILWPDADDAGERHAKTIQESLERLGIDWDIIDWPEAKEGDDADDYFNRGGTLDAIPGMLSRFPKFEAIVNAKCTPLNELAHLIDKEVEYAIHPICPKGALTMVQGMPKGGKSTFSLWVALCASIGHWPSGILRIDKPLKVLFIEFEDRPILVVKRASRYLAGAGFDPKILPSEFILCDSPTLWLDSDKHERALIKEIQTKKYDLVVIDTLSFIHRAEDENASADMKVLTAALKRIVAETNSSILFIHHTGKGSKDKAVTEAARGSSVIPACADVIINWGDRQGGDVTPVSVVSKYDDGFKCSVEYVKGEEGAVAWKLEVDAAQPKRGKEAIEDSFQTARDVILKSGGGAKYGSLVGVLKDSGYGDRTAKDHISRLVQGKRLTKTMDENGQVKYVLGGPREV